MCFSRLKYPKSHTHFLVVVIEKCPISNNSFTWEKSFVKENELSCINYLVF